MEAYNHNVARGVYNTERVPCVGYRPAGPVFGPLKYTPPKFDEVHRQGLRCPLIGDQYRKVVQGQLYLDGTYGPDRFWKYCADAMFQILLTFKCFVHKLSRQAFTHNCPYRFGNFVVKNTKDPNSPFSTSFNMSRVRQTYSPEVCEALETKTSVIRYVVHRVFNEVLCEDIPYESLATIVHERAIPIIRSHGYLLPCSEPICEDDIFVHDVPESTIKTWIAGHIKLHFDKKNDDGSKKMPPKKHPRKFVGECPYDLFGLTVMDRATGEPFETSHHHRNTYREENADEIRSDVKKKRVALWKEYTKYDEHDDDLAKKIFDGCGEETGLSLEDVEKWLSKIWKLDENYKSPYRYVAENKVVDPALLAGMNLNPNDFPPLPRQNNVETNEHDDDLVMTNDSLEKVLDEYAEENEMRDEHLNGDVDVDEDVEESVRKEVDELVMDRLIQENNDA